MNKREELKKKLISDNHNEEDISDREKLDYYDRLKKGYVKNDTLKRFIYQYLEGDGNELNGKFFKVYSSSRLCFEMFSYLVNDTSVTDFEFEYHLPSLYSKHHIRLHGANMDVFYVKENEITFIESKFTETVYNHIKDIDDAYYKEYGEAKSKNGFDLHSTLTYRYHNNKELARLFPGFVNKVVIYMASNNLESRLDYFDVKQEIGHLLGIAMYIYANKKKLSDITDIHFYNVIYDFKEERSKLANYVIEQADEMMNLYLSRLKLDIFFHYDIRTMQDIAKTIDDKKVAFGTNKTVKEILKSFYVFDNEPDLPIASEKSVSEEPVAEEKEGSYTEMIRTFSDESGSFSDEDNYVVTYDNEE